MLGIPELKVLYLRQTTVRIFHFLSQKELFEKILNILKKYEKSTHLVVASVGNMQNKLSCHLKIG
jgi:hypothetical protein